MLPLFLCCLQSIATHRDHFVCHPSVCPSICLYVCPSVTLFCHTFQSYVWQATHAFLGILPLFFIWKWLNFVIFMRTFLCVVFGICRVKILNIIECFEFYSCFMPLAWTVSWGHPVIRLSINLSFCPFVCNSVLFTMYMQSAINIIS